MTKYRTELKIPDGLFSKDMEPMAQNLLRDMVFSGSFAVKYETIEQEDGVKVLVATAIPKENIYL